MAAVGVEALLDSAHDGQRYDLTGPTLLTFTDQADILERVLGRPVKTVEVDTRIQLAAMGLPPDVAAEIAVGADWARSGGAAYVTEHVSRILGRPAGTFEQWAIDHREAFDAMR